MAPENGIVSLIHWMHHVPFENQKHPNNKMRKPYWLALILGVAVLAASACYYVFRSQSRSQDLAVLSFLPQDPAAVLYVDLSALRHTAFLAQLAAWAPQPQKDSEYAQFLQDTGFDFERDLDHLAIATQKLAGASNLFFIADGKFDRKKISAYALRTGAKQNINGHEIFGVPLDSGKGRLSFAFISDHLVILTDGGGLADKLGNSGKKLDQQDWQERFRRLAGSPAFAVIRQDAGAALAERAPGGFRSPQLSSLLNQLQWITVAAKPDGDQLRIIAEGESASDATARQLADLLNGVVILAQAGLNDPKVRQQLDPAVREAYLELLKDTDISKLDRGDTKAVRLVVSVTPKFLQAARTYSPLAPPQPPAQPDTRKAPAAAPRKSGT
jgi:hypothetical protein